MGHRALIAYERPDGQYTLHYSHWGGCNLRLKHAITRATPFAGDDPGNQWVAAAFDLLQEGVEPDPEVSEVDRPETDVDPIPWATGLSLDAAIREHLNFVTHEAFYVVSSGFRVTAYRTFPLQLADVSQRVESVPAVGHGILSTVRWYDGEPVGDAHRRGWFTGAKHAVGWAVDRRALSPKQATDLLVEWFRETSRPQETVRVARASTRD